MILYFCVVIIMAKEFAKGFYNSAAWVKCRAAYIASVFGLCERCKRVGKILHHKIVLTPQNIINPLVTLSWDNLIFVCKDCHEAEHSNSVTRKDVMFDTHGNLIQRIGPPINNRF